MARKLQEILDGVKLTGADSDQLAKTLTTQAATPRTDDELRAEAERAVGSLYSEKQLAAQQRYDREQTALRSQLDALGTSYQRQAEQAEKNTRLALSGADQRALSRGMGRSSYNLATLGNIQSEGNRTLDYIQEHRTGQESAINEQMTLQSQQLADILAEYQTNRETDIMARMDQLRATDKQDARAATEYNNALIMALADRLSQERERERAQSNWQMQFDEGVRQFNAGLSEQQKARVQSQENWLKQFEESVRQNDAKMAEQVRQFNASLSLDEKKLQLSNDQFQESIRQFNVKNPQGGQTGYSGYTGSTTPKPKPNPEPPKQTLEDRLGMTGKQQPPDFPTILPAGFHIIGQSMQTQKQVASPPSIMRSQQELLTSMLNKKTVAPDNKKTPGMYWSTTSSIY